MKHDKERLRWQCRRGMLELDLLLEQFLDQQFDHLSSDAQYEFIKLLQQPDPSLNSWIFGVEKPDYKPFAHLIRMLKQV